MSVEANFATAEFLGDNFSFIDCPGSIEFQQDSLSALKACDAAIVVCEPDPKRVAALQVIFKDAGTTGIYAEQIYVHLRSSLKLELRSGQVLILD